MEIILAIYLTLAGVLYAGHKHGGIPDDTTIKTYQFEAKVCENNGDILKATYLNGRLAQWKEEIKSRNLLTPK